MDKAAISLVVLFLMLLYSDNQVFAKGAAVDWFPAEFESLNAADWPEIQLSLNAAIRNPVPDLVTLENLLERAEFLLRRLTTIEWSESERDEVEEFLWNYAEEVVRELDFGQQTPESAALICGQPRVLFRRDLGHVAVWAASRIGRKLPEPERLFGLWGSYSANCPSAAAQMRWAVLRVLEAHINDAEIPQIVWQLGQKALASHQDAIPLKQISQMHELARFENQQTAWEFIWSQIQPRQTAQVITTKFRPIWGEWYMLLEKVYDLDPEITLRLADEARDRYKKYFFLNATVCILRANLVHRTAVPPGVVIDDAFTNRVERQAFALAKTIADSEIRNMDGFENYLHESVKWLRKRPTYQASSTKGLWQNSHNLPVAVASFLALTIGFVCYHRYRCSEAVLNPVREGRSSDRRRT